MPIYHIVERAALVFAVASSAGFLAMNEGQTAIAALAIWPLTRALISVLDVFVVFFTEKPLVRSTAYKTSPSDFSVSNTSD
jgi:hypothetical protein